MRKVISLLLLLLCLSILFVSCSEKKDAEPAVISTSSSSEAAPAAYEAAKGKQTSVVIYDGTPFYSEGTDGKMSYASVDAKLGETLSIITLDGKINQKNAIRIKTGGEDEVMFVNVEYDGAEYWTRDIFITDDPSFIPAVIKDDVFTYKTPDVSDPYPSDKKFELGTIVAIGEAIESDGDKFIPVKKYTGTSFGTEVYVKDSAITTNSADIVAVQALKRVEAYGDDLKDEVYYEVIEQIAGLNLSPDVRFYLGL